MKKQFKINESVHKAVSLLKNLLKCLKLLLEIFF